MEQAKNLINRLNLLYVLAALIVIVLLWATFTRIDVYVTAEGKVVTSGQVKVVQNLEGGILKQVLVNEGDKVSKGQLVAILDETQFKSAYQRDLVKKVLLDAEIIRLNTELQAKTQLDIPKDMQEHYPEIVQKIQNIFQLNQAALQDELKAIDQSKKLIQEELKILLPLSKQGVVSKLDIIELQKQLNGLEIQKVQRQEEYRSRAREELKQAEQDRELLIQTLSATEDRFVRTKIYSPTNGMVNQIYVRTNGEVINPGQKIMDFVASDEALQIQAYIDPKDIGFVHIGQNAKIKISAYDFALYGYLDGQVSNLSPDAITNDKGNSYYQIDVSVPHPYFKKNGSFAPLKPGMMATVNIVVGKRSILTYIIKPVSNLTSSALRER